MLPDEPNIDQEYVLVRPVGSDIAWVAYTRLGDGCARYQANGVYARSVGMNESFFADGFVCEAECSPSAWEKPWNDLRVFGFLEVAEARRQGAVPPDWEPPRRVAVWTPPPSGFLLVEGLRQPPTVHELSALRRVFPTLADCSVNDLRSRLASSAAWSAGYWALDICTERQREASKLGLRVRIADSCPDSIPRF